MIKATHIAFLFLLSVLGSSSVLPIETVHPPVNYFEGITYSGLVCILINSQFSRFTFSATFFEYEDNCESVKCFYGRINNYTTPIQKDDQKEKTTIIGYGNPYLTPQPVFRLETNGKFDFRIVYPEALEEDWKQIIVIACKEFNPVQAESSEDQGNLRRLQTENENTENNQEQLAKFKNRQTKVITMTDDKMIQESKQTYEVDFGSDNDEDSEGTQGKATLDMKLEGKEPITSEDAQSIIEEVTENSETKEFNASSLTPTEDIHIVSEGQEDFENQAESENKSIQGRNLQRTKKPQPQKIYTIFNKTEQLFKKVIFGRKLIAKYKAYCQLLIYPNKDNYLKCKHEIEFVYKKTKSYTLSFFSKKLGTKIAQKKNFNPKITFDIYIGIPKIVGVTLKLQLGLNYSRRLFGNVLNAYPYKYEIGVQYGLNIYTDSKVQLKIALVKGGAYIKGRLFEMTTTPTATLSYSKDRKSIDLVGYWPGKRQSTKAEGGLYTAAKKVRKLFRRSIESWNYNYYAQFSITNTYRQWTIFYGKLNIKV